MNTGYPVRYQAASSLRGELDWAYCPKTGDECQSNRAARGATSPTKSCVQGR